MRPRLGKAGSSSLVALQQRQSLRSLFCLQQTATRSSCESPLMAYPLSSVLVRSVCLLYAKDGHRDKVRFPPIADVRRCWQPRRVNLRIRLATVADNPGMHRVRKTVPPFRPHQQTEALYLPYVDARCAWLAEIGIGNADFAAINAKARIVGALFVAPTWEQNRHRPHEQGPATLPRPDIVRSSEG